MAARDPPPTPRGQTGRPVRAGDLAAKSVGAARRAAAPLDAPGATSEPGSSHTREAPVHLLGQEVDE